MSKTKPLVTPLALFGGQPLFSRPLTTGQQANRAPEQFFALATACFERRRLTNQGPMLDELEERLSELHGTRHCIAVANAAFALLLGLHALALPCRRNVILPALGFHGLSDLIRWAGLEPQFCDVDPLTHTLSPGRLADLIDADTAAVLAEDNAHAVCDIDALERLTTSHGVPLLIDAVHAAGGRYPDTPGLDRTGSRGTATIFSLHASTLINGFEGGYLTTDDDQLATRLRRQRTFGFSDGAVLEPGLNAKLNELHAAMALSSLDHLPAIIGDNRQRFACYQRHFLELPWVSLADYSQSPGTFSRILLKVEDPSPYSRDELVRILCAENVLAKPHYSPPLHALPVSEHISGQYIRMPAGDQTGEPDIEQLARLFQRLDADADSIVARLRP